MSISLVDNVGDSFKFAFDHTAKKLLRWIGLSIVFWIPIVQFLAIGIFMKVYRGEEPDFTNAGKSFIQGLLIFLAQIVYALIPSLIIILCAMLGASEGAGVLALIGIIVGIVLAVILGFLMIPVQVNLARKQSFGAAFAFGEIFGMIGKLGLAKFILAWLLYFVIILAVSIVLGILSVVPVVGAILMFLYGPFIGIFAAKYYSNLFE